MVDTANSRLFFLPLGVIQRTCSLSAIRFMRHHKSDATWLKSSSRYLDSKNLATRTARKLHIDRLRFGTLLWFDDHQFFPFIEPPTHLLGGIALRLESKELPIHFGCLREVRALLVN